MLQSNGVLVKSTMTLWEGTTATFPGFSAIPLTSNVWSSYQDIYASQLWPNIVIDKRSNLAARLPFKIYERTADGRDDGSSTPFGTLMRRPSRSMHPFDFWRLTVLNLDIYGESFWLKVRDAGGRPVELIPIHPTKVITESSDTGRTTWKFRVRGEDVGVQRRDLVHFRWSNPASPLRGISKLEPLRATLENEDGARRANSALWRNGGRPSVYLQHPGILKNKAVADRLRSQWDDIHGGVDNWAKAAVLEEGMTANFLPLDVEELQYIEARKLNRDEVLSAFDIPPPAAHVVDRATFSNIVEQFRSVYRDTMGPVLGLLESTVDFELRDGRFGDSGQPDFGDAFYGEFLLDEVLRGDFEARQDAYEKATYMTIAEKRQKENLPFIPGTDHIFLNSATLPLGPDGLLIQPAPEPVAAIEPVSEQLALPPAPKSVDVRFTTEELRPVLGRIGRVKSLREIDAGKLVEGIDEQVADNVLAVLVTARAKNEAVDGFKSRLRALTGKEA